MDWLSTQTFLIDFLASVIGFASNWMLQSTLLASIGLLVGRLLRRRGSAVQSVVYRTALVAALICPVATFALSQAGFNGWSIEMPRAWVAQPTQVPADEGGGLTIVAVDPTSPNFVTAASEADSLAGVETPYVAAESLAEPIDLEQPRSTAVTQEPPLAALPATPEPFSEGVTKARGSTATLFGWAAVAASLAWLVVSGLLTMRIFGAWWKLAHLRRVAIRADEATRDTCQQLSETMNVSPPDVRCSPYLPSPCLSGVWKPAVLLPETELSLPLRDVLIHELAHLRRRDCHWNLLRQAATALFFFQPLLWMLSRRIEATAEEVCDDYVVLFGGNREEYAHRLVDIAELSSAPIAAAGVGIVSLRSMLARRVTRILDTSRSLSTRVGNLLLVAVLVSGFTGATATGLIGLAPAPSRAESAEESAGTTEAGGDFDEETAKEVAADKSEWAIAKGTVVGPDGKPVPGATIEVQRWIFYLDESKEPLATTRTDEVGEFVIRYPQEEVVTLVASHDGFGAGFVDSDMLRANEEATIQLVRDSVPVRGQVVDVEGNPIADIKVNVGGLAATEDENLDNWLQAIDRGQILWGANNRFFVCTTPQNPANLPVTVMTDKDGFFSIKGLGRDRKISLAFEGQNIAYTPHHCCYA